MGTQRVLEKTLFSCSHAWVIYLHFGILIHASDSFAAGQLKSLLHARYFTENNSAIQYAVDANYDATFSKRIHSRSRCNSICVCAQA